MNICSQCGYEAKDEAEFCLKCGSPIGKAHFCKKCGNPLEQGAAFCAKCGNRIGAAPLPQYAPPPLQYPYQYAPPPQTLLQTLSKKIQTGATIWLIIGILQMAMSILIVFYGISVMSISLIQSNTNTGLNMGHVETDNIAPANIVPAMIFLGLAIVFLGIFIFIGIFNFVKSIKNFKYSRKILKRPVGIVKKLEPLGGYIVRLICNLIFGGIAIFGIFTLIGSIYSLAAIRSFVVAHADELDAIEQDYIKEYKNHTAQCNDNRNQYGNEPPFTDLPPDTQSKTE